MNDDNTCIEVDPARVAQRIVNLVINSRHATPLGGKMIVRCERVELESNHVTKHGDELLHGPYLRISVADTGNGIDPKSAT